MLSNYLASEVVSNKLDQEKKYKLSTGKIVEEALFEFGKQCRVNHPACSMILDLQDKTYLKEGVFTKDETNEMMRMKDPKTTVYISRIPKELVTYMSAYNFRNIKDLRPKLLKNEDWEVDYL